MSLNAYLTYDGNRKQNREDLLDFMTMLSPIETPIFDRLPKNKATNVYHEYVSDELARSAGNVAHAEGADYTFSTLPNPTRNVNYVEEIAKPYKVSITQTLVDAVGGNELSRRRLNAMKQWKMDMEREIIFASGNSGSSGTARIMKGIITSLTKATNASNASLTQGSFNSYIQSVWNDVSDGTYLAYMDMAVKRDISQFFITSTVKNLEASDVTKLSTKIDVYQSDVAKDVLLYGHRDLTASKRLLIVQERAMALAILENPRDMDVASTGSYVSGVVRGSGTLEMLFPKGGISVSQLSTVN